MAADFVTLAEDTGSAETGYADDTVENGRVYVYRVLAIGPGGVSEPSREVRVSTLAPVAPRQPLTGTRAHVFSTLLSNLGQGQRGGQCTNCRRIRGSSGVHHRPQQPRLQPERQSS